LRREHVNFMPVEMNYTNQRLNSTKARSNRQKIVKLITGGGLGDAAMSIGNLYGDHQLFDWNGSIHLTHVEVPPKLLNAISAFYSTQKVNHTVTQIKSWEWLKKNRGEFDHYLGTSWHENDCNEKTWEMNPFPPIIHSKVDRVDIVITPTAGRGASRKFDLKEIEKFSLKYGEKYSIFYVGNVSEETENFIAKLPGKSLLNNTTMKELIDVLCSCSIFIGHAGFCAYLSAMSGSLTYLVPEVNSSKRIHPKWKVNKIKSLKQIDLSNNSK
jgi:hypothetical protein